MQMGANETEWSDKIKFTFMARGKLEKDRDGTVSQRIGWRCVEAADNFHSFVDCGAMSFLVTILLLQLLPTAVCIPADHDCLFRRSTSVRKDGDVLIGGLFYLGQDKICNFNCGKGTKSVAVLTGTPWATAAQIGPLLELYKFPQVRVCGVDKKVKLCLLWFRSRVSKKLSFGSFDPMLNNNGQLPSFYQMASKDTSLAHGMVSLMLYFSWTWVGLIITEGQKGLEFLSHVRGEMDRSKICVAFVKMVKNALVSVVPPIKQHDFMTRESSPVNVVIIYYDTDSLNDVNYHIGQHLVTWRVWVTNSQWHADMAGRNFILDSFHGTLVFSNHHEEISGFKTFIHKFNPSTYPEDTFLALYWFQYFHCSLSASDCALENCPPNASLAWLPVNRFDMTLSDGSYNIYNAVYAVAHVLHEMLLQHVQMQPTGGGERLHPFLKNIQFTSATGDQVSLDDRKKPHAKYDILNIWNFPDGLGLRAKVGQFSPQAPHGQQLLISEEVIQWATEITETPHSKCNENCNPGFRKTPQEGKPACCFDCTPCPENESANDTGMEQCVKCSDDQYANTQRNRCLEKLVTFLAYEDPLGKALAGTALAFTLLTAFVFGLFVKHRNTPIVKANNRSLSYNLLIALMFCFLCSLLFIGRPSTATCVLQQTTFGVVFTVAVSTILAKTVTVVLAFKVTGPGKRMRHLLVSGAPNSIIPICSLIQLTLCGIWMGTSPPFIDTDAHSEHGHIIIVCNKGSLKAFYCVLGYLGSLALGSFTLAFLARNLPDTFNEAKYLTFSMLVFCSVWVTFLPVYHSTKGKAMVAMEVFSILASSAGLLGCIFAPKCYVILFRPDTNSLQEFRDKTYSRKKHSSGVKTSRFL
ncbi:vomeronasal type-2 receptor 116-like [Ctenodactylus gundi]